jgi:DNA polymerase I-like protein with 3'-5' exonuclease and polymerase domains
VTFLQQALFPPDASWRPPVAADLPSDWNATRRLGIDTETCDPTLKKLGCGARRGAFIAGISFALHEDRAHYLPLRHLGGDNVSDPQLALGYVRYQAKRFTGEVVGANLQYDLDMLAQAGIDFPLATFRDVQVAEPLLDELQFSYSLDAILGRHGMELKVEETLRRAAEEYRVDPKADLWKLPARYVGLYAEGDAIRPLQLLKRQEEQLREQGLWKVWDLESAVLPCLVRLRRRGVPVDFDRLDKVERFSKAEEAIAWSEIQRITGVSIRVGDAMKPEVIAPALEHEGVRVPLTAKRKPSITKDWLATLDTPVAGLIRRARQMSQLRSTFVASIRTHAVDGRIHCTFNQLRKTKDDDSDSEDEGARYGRLSCSDPNLQQQPARDPEIGPMWRAIYVAEPGALWGQLDYSQQEPRWAVHFGIVSGSNRIGPLGYQSACEMRDRYTNDRSTDGHTAFTAMVHGDHVLEWAAAAKNGDKAAGKQLKLLRDPAKNIYLGICYGMGGPKLCRSVGLPTKVIAHWKTGRQIEVAGDEGQALLDLVNERVPYVKKTAEAVEAVAKLRGFVRTVSGRKCRFPMDEHGNPDWTFKAFNRVIQGSSADQTKEALVALDREGFDIRLQVHDEYDGMFSSEAEARRAADIMESCTPCEVPAKVDVGLGPSWGEVVE